MTSADGSTENAARFESRCGTNMTREPKGHAQGQEQNLDFFEKKIDMFENFDNFDNFENFEKFEFWDVEFISLTSHRGPETAKSMCVRVGGERQPTA